MELAQTPGPVARIGDCCALARVFTTNDIRQTGFSYAWWSHPSFSSDPPHHCTTRNEQKHAAQRGQSHLVPRDGDLLDGQNSRRRLLNISPSLCEKTTDHRGQRPDVEAPPESLEMRNPRSLTRDLSQLLIQLHGACFYSVRWSSHSVAIHTRYSSQHTCPPSF